jgi:tetratricopeptide (TPR) repeat protein
MDRRKVTTSSDKAYQAYLKGEDLVYRLYLREALEQFGLATRLDPNFAMAHARSAWLYKSFNNDSSFEESRARALALLGRVKEKERLVINLGFSRFDQRTTDVERYANELIEKYPSSLEALEYTADKLFKEGKFQEAIVQINKIVEQYPNHAPSYNLLGYAYFYIGEYDKALANIDKYTSLAEDQANPYDSRGELLLFMGRYDDAIAQFRKADRIKPDLHFVIAHIGTAYAAKGMYRDAIGALMKAAELCLNKEAKATIKSEMAICYFESDQPARAMEILQETVDTMPDHLRSHAILGGIYAEIGRMEDALIQLGIAKGLTSGLLALPEYQTNEAVIKSAEFYLAGEISLAKGDYMDAANKFEWVVNKITPPDKLLFSAFLADALIRAEKPDSAIVILTGCLNQNPNSEICLRFLAQAYKETGQKEGQRAILTRYLTVMKDADEGLKKVTQASTSLNQLNKALL